MKNTMILGSGLKFLGVVAVLWSLLTPWAVAGPEEDNELAINEYARGNLVVSMGLWRKAAQQGYAPAQVWLGFILDAAEENDEAVDWYRKATNQGSAAGEFGLGQMYLKGEGVKKDLEQGRLHVMRAAEKGELDAMMLVMESYRLGGLGLAVDPVQAEAWELKVIALSPGYKRASEKDKDKDKKGKTK